MRPRLAKTILQLAGDRNSILSDHYIISTKIDFFDSIDPQRTPHY